jgi:hypothetical protein
MKAAKTITTLLLLLLLVVPMFYSAGLLIKQKLIQYEMEEKLENVSLQTIALPATNLQWIKEGKEILIKGKLFDVKSITFSNENILLTGIYDQEEDVIKQKIAEAGNHHSKSESTVPWVFIVQYYEVFPVFEFQQTWLAVTISYPNYADSLIQGVNTTPAHPPGA